MNMFGNFDFSIFRWTDSGSGTYLDRSGMLHSITYLGISFWDVLYVDFEDIYNFKMKNSIFWVT